MGGSKKTVRKLPQTNFTDFPSVQNRGKGTDQPRDSREIVASNQETFLTEQELAARHRRSVKTLRNARVSGSYVKFVRIGRSIRYRLSDVIAYEIANLMRSTSDLPVESG
jgi:hypothetical protein